MIEFINDSWDYFDDTLIIYEDRDGSIKYCHQIPQVVHDYLIENDSIFDQLRIKPSIELDNKLCKIRDHIGKMLNTNIRSCNYAGVVYKNCTLSIKYKERIYFIDCKEYQ